MERHIKRAWSIYILSKPLAEVIPNPVDYFIDIWWRQALADFEMCYLATAATPVINMGLVSRDVWLGAALSAAPNPNIDDWTQQEDRRTGFGTRAVS